MFVDWVNDVEKRVGGTSRFTLEPMNSEPHVYLLCDDDEDAAGYARVDSVKPAIFEVELAGWYNDPDLWPRDRSIAFIDQWLSFSRHTMVIDVGTARLKKQERYP